MWCYIVAAVLPVMVMMQECPEQQSAPSSGVVTRPYQGILINNIQWIHVPVLVNLTAWSPDMDERCHGEGVMEMYKALITTVFLRYHSAVAINSPAGQSPREPPKDHLGEAPTRRKLLGFVDKMLGASGVGLGISNWISEQELKHNELKLKALVGLQVLQTDAFLQEALNEVKSSQVTFIYIALFTIQIVSKQLHSDNMKVARTTQINNIAKH